MEVEAHPPIISSAASGARVAWGSKSALSAWESVRLWHSTWTDLWVRVSASDRETPLVAGANCTLVARRLAVRAVIYVLLVSANIEPKISGQRQQSLHELPVDLNGALKRVRFHAGAPTARPAQRRPRCPDRN